MLPHSQACERNQQPILDVLRGALAPCRDVLEIGSGTGQHAVYFAQALGHLIWQASEQAALLPDLRRRIEPLALPNLPLPLELDVTAAHWPLMRAQAVFSANTLHILSWPAVTAMFAGIGRILGPQGRVALYGPFNRAGQYTAASNERFDALLRARDPLSGIRDLEQVEREAQRHGLLLRQDHPMPANNRLLLFERAA